MNEYMDLAQVADFLKDKGLPVTSSKLDKTKKKVVKNLIQKHDAPFLPKGRTLYMTQEHVETLLEKMECRSNLSRSRVQRTGTSVALTRGSKSSSLQKRLSGKSRRQN